MISADVVDGATVVDRRRGRSNALRRPKQQSVWTGSSIRSVKIWVTTKQQSGRQLLSFKSTVATVFDTVDECNCGVLATQASVGPTRVGCYLLWFTGAPDYLAQLPYTARPQDQDQDARDKTLIRVKRA